MSSERTEPIQSSKSRSEGINAQTRTDLVERHLARLSQFLRYCVERESFPDLWSPPADLRSHVGVKPANGSPSRKGDPLTDQQIIDLLAALPDDEAGRRWSDAIRLCSELGLRAIELLHLSVRRDPSSREFHWWCGYSKRSGGGATEPRRLESLP
jgi:integrase